MKIIIIVITKITIIMIIYIVVIMIMIILLLLLLLLLLLIIIIVIIVKTIIIIIIIVVVVEVVVVVVVVLPVLLTGKHEYGIGINTACSVLRLIDLSVGYSLRFIAMVIGVHNIRMDHSPTTDISSARNIETSSRCGCSLNYMIAWTRGLLR